jgi:hypothetical protein
MVFSCPSSGFLDTAEPQQAQRVERYQCRRPGIGKNGNPEAGHAQNSGDQEQTLESKREHHVLRMLAMVARESSTK